MLVCPLGVYCFLDACLRHYLWQFAGDDNDAVAAVVDTCVVVAVVVDAVDGDDGDNVVDAGKLHCCNQVPL